MPKPTKGERRTTFEEMQEAMTDLNDEVLIDPSAVMEGTAPHDDGDDTTE